jgi:hypothetical protein
LGNPVPGRWGGKIKPYFNPDKKEKTQIKQGEFNWMFPVQGIQCPEKMKNQTDHLHFFSLSFPPAICLTQESFPFPSGKFHTGSTLEKVDLDGPT